MTPHDHPEAALRRDAFEHDGAARGTARMEAFADGVFAIAITLPIVEFHLPGPEEHLRTALIELWPQYLGLTLASLVIGLYWVLHHFSGAIYRSTGHWFNLATVVFLVGIGFVAFPARVFAESLPEAADRGDAARYFVIALALLGCSWLFKWTVGRRTGHVDARLEPAYVARLNRVYVISTLLLVTAAALSFVSWPAGLALAAAVTLYYIRPPGTPAYTTEAPKVEGEETGPDAGE